MLGKRVLDENKKLDGDGYLLDDTGSRLTRTLGETDDDLRRRMVKSIVATDETSDVEWETLGVVEADGGRWIPANLGRTFVSNNAVHNLFAAVPAQGSGIGTVMQLGGGAYMVNNNGDRFPLRRSGKQLRFDAMVIDRSGSRRIVEFVHDSGAAANILRSNDGATWTERGDGVVYMGGFTGGQDKMIGGNDLRVFLRADDTVNNTVESDVDDKLSMGDVLAQVALEEGADSEEILATSTAAAAKQRLDDQKNDAQLNDQHDQQLEDKLGEQLDEQLQGSRDSNDQIDNLLAGLGGELKARVLSRLASAKSVIVALGKEGKRYRFYPDDTSDDRGTKLTAGISRQMGIVRRMKTMERAAEIYPHLSTLPLNKMVRDGDIPDGIEFHPKAKIQDEATMIGRGTKARTTKKRDPDRGPDAGLGVRPPFFVIIADLIDLQAETQGNRWGYNYLLTLMCKEYGVAKVYPITGKTDVRRVWRQFKQWVEIISPYVVAKLGVAPKIHIFAADRGPEFVTTHGRQRSAMDEELLRDGIARWNPSAGDSNKCGKIEAFNRVLVGAINVAMRRGGARNTYAYDAATHFESHFNMAPTKFNIAGCGEAPFRTLGIPMWNEKLVRFFCPAWLTPHKHQSVDTGKSVAQKHLTARKVRCFIIGYGSGMTEGSDSDGYKVVLASSGGVYSSMHVTPTPEMEVSKSFLTGLRHDPLKEGVLIRRIFDIDGTEDLGDAGLRQHEGKQPSTLDETPGGTTKQQRKMTVGTGVTGQMRNEMDTHVEKTTKNDLMSKESANEEIRLARRYDKGFIWKAPSDANKRGRSGQRYEIYSQSVKTFKDYDRVRKRKKSMLPGDLLNDLRKGHVSFEPSPGVDEEMAASAENIYEHEMDEDHVLLSHENKDPLKSSENSVMIPTDSYLQLGAKDHLTDNIRGLFFEQIVAEAREELGVESVPAWLALGVFHHAEIWVEGRKQPGGLKEAMRLPEWSEWKEAIRNEVQGLIEIGVWAEVPRKTVPHGVKVLPGKMILEIKTEDGKFKKCKARYVSRGDLATRGEHFWETSSHQVRAKSFRMFFATAVADYAKKKERCYVPRSLDIKQAYIKRKRGAEEPELYMDLPDYTDGLCRDKSSGYVAKMLRHLYGEPDGGRAFEREYMEFMDKIGAVATVSDRMVYQWQHNGATCKILAHVDDLIYSGTTDEVCDAFFRAVKDHFGECTGGGIAKVVLGIKIDWEFEKCTVKLSQRAHTEKLLEEFGFDPSNTSPKKSPLPLNVVARENTERRIGNDEWDYFKWCGFANWLATNTRVDIAGAVNLCGRYSQNPGSEHVALEKHVLRYLAGTLDEGITYHGSNAVLNKPYPHRNKLIGYADSDHGGCHDTKRSTSCVIIQLNGGPVIWRVMKQRVVTTSTPHSESIALASAVQELVWACDFMAEIGYEQQTVRLLEDNQSAILQATGDYKSSKSDHYRKVQFYIEDNYRKGLVWLDKIPTDYNIADIGTKQVSPLAKFEKLRDIASGKAPHLYLGQKVKDILNGKFGDTGL